MACCGNGRSRVAAALARAREQRPVALVAVPAGRPPVTFEYTGETAMAVTGPVTRTTYRFPATGARVPVDGRDAGAVAGVPNLRRAG